jgi:putative ABC transport system permease protein
VREGPRGLRRAAVRGGDLGRDGQAEAGAPVPPAAQTVSLLAASPGAVQAMGLRMTAGSPLTPYENDTGQHVAMIDTATAAALGISPARLASRPAVFVDGIAYTVVGVYGSAQRRGARPGPAASGPVTPEAVGPEDHTEKVTSIASSRVRGA